MLKIASITLFFLVSTGLISFVSALIASADPFVLFGAGVPALSVIKFL